MPAETRVTRLVAVPAALERVHLLMRELWAACPEVSDQERMSFETAVAEVAANVVEHAAAAGDVPLQLVMRISDEVIEMLLEDSGSPYLGPTAATDEPLAESGRGLAMAAALVDRVEYERDGGTNRWLIVLHRAASRPGAG